MSRSGVFHKRTSQLNAAARYTFVRWLKPYRFTNRREATELLVAKPEPLDVLSQQHYKPFLFVWIIVHIGALINESTELLAVGIVMATVLLADTFVVTLSIARTYRFYKFVMGPELLREFAEVLRQNSNAPEDILFEMAYHLANIEAQQFIGESK